MLQVYRPDGINPDLNLVDKGNAFDFTCKSSRPALWFFLKNTNLAFYNRPVSMGNILRKRSVTSSDDGFYYCYGIKDNTPFISIGITKVFCKFVMQFTYVNSVSKYITFKCPYYYEINYIKCYN